MATLDLGITADQLYVPNTDVAAGFYQLGSEIIRVQAERYSTRGLYGQPVIGGVLVARGVAGSTRAAHASGVTFTPVADPAVPGGGGGSSPVLVATTLLTSAQILAMHDTPVELVPAPGAGKAIAVINIAAALTFATTSYETGEDLDVTYDGDANTLLSGLFIGFLTADASGGGEFATGPSSGELVSLLTAVENKAIVATCLTANPENGDSDVFVTILYAVVDLA